MGTKGTNTAEEAIEARKTYLTEVADIVFGNKEKSELWLNLRHTSLGGQSPLQLAAESDDGLDRVTEIVAKIDHGFHA